jgi:acetyltransferase-like isoleucine patch superfamily enzyme
MNMLVKLYLYMNVLLQRLKGLVWILDLKLKGANVSWSAQVKGRIRIVSARKLTIGKYVGIGRDVTINTADGSISIAEHAILGSFVRLDAMNGKINIGRNVLINTHSIITAWSGVDIGEDTRIAPFCHITDRSHGLEKDTLIRKQFGDTVRIHIGRDVWIGSSCVILQGITIGDGAVVGANSVVNRAIPSYTIMAGSPARIIGERTHG